MNKSISNKSKRILVFGGNKFLGKNIIEQIQNKLPKADVFSLTRSGIQENKQKDISKNSPQNLPTILKGDRTNSKELETVLGDLEFDIVFDASTYQAEQIKPSLEILKDRVKTWALVSSAGVYAKTEFFPTEESFPKVTSQPHVGKLECEDLLKSTNSLHTFCIRPFYIYGPENTFDRESFFFRSIEAEKEILIPNEGSALLQFASVEDIASVFVDLALLPKEQTQHKAFNVGDKTIHSINSIIQTCGKIIGKDAKVKYFSVAEAKEKGFQVRDIFPLRAEHYFGDLENLNKVGLQTSNNLEQGLRKTYNWFKQNRDLYPKYFMTEAGELLMAKL